jgi:hypothetical protein
MMRRENSFVLFNSSGLGLAEQTTQLVEREAGEAQGIIEQPLDSVTSKTTTSRP